MIKAVVFDWGGVIAPNNGGGWLPAYAALLGLEHDEALKLWKYAYEGLNTGEISEDEFWNRTENVYGRPLPANKSDIWSNGLAERVWPDMMAYVQELQTKGYTTALLSNIVAPVFPNEALSKNYEHFSPVVLSNEVGLAKPDTRIYTLLLDRVGLESDECIFIDDAPRNVEAARALGFHTVLADEDPSKNIQAIENLLNT